MTGRYGVAPFVLALAAVLFTPVALQPVHAQDAPDEVSSLADTVKIEGERLAIDPLRIPGGATLVTREEWATARLAGMDDALAQVPGLLAQTRSGGQDVRITIRGFGARGAGDRSNAGTTRGIRISLDGFPLTEPDGRTSLDLTDLGIMDAIRVIRSNSSGLYGPASGGLVDLYSTSRFSAPFVDASLQWGSFGYAQRQARFGVVSGRARISLSVADGNFDGWRDQSGGSQTMVMGSVQVDPSPRTEVGVFVTGTHNLQRQPGALTQAEFDADPRQADPAYESQNARRDNRIVRVAGKLEQQIGDDQTLRLGLFAEPKALHRSERNRYRDFQRVHLGGSLLYTVPFGIGETPVTCTSGVDDFYQDGSVLFYDLGPGGTRGTELIANQREGINTFGIFTEFAFSPAEAWDVTAGARWDDIYYVTEDHISPQLDDTRHMDRVSPRATVSYQASPAHHLYAALSSGIEAPAFNEIDPPPPYDTLTTLNPFLDPAHSLTFEVGAKGSFHFGRGFDTTGYDVALYTLTVENEIIPWDGGTFYRTAGKSRRSGFEMGLSAGTDNGFTGRVSLTASRNRYIDYETGEIDADTLVTVNYDDNESAGIPSTVFNASLRYTMERGPYLEGIYGHVGEYFANDANTDVVEASNVFDLTVGTNHRFGRTNFGVFVSGRNLTDEKYASSAYVNGANGRYLEPGIERNVLVGVSFGGAGEPR